MVVVVVVVVVVTSLDKLLTFVFRHVLLEVSVDKAVDVRAAGASDGAGLPHTHPTEWNAVHLINMPTSPLIITT